MRNWNVADKSQNLYASAVNNDIRLRRRCADSNSAILPMPMINISSAEPMTNCTPNQREMKSGKQCPYLRKGETELSMIRNEMTGSLTWKKGKETFKCGISDRNVPTQRAPHRMRKIDYWETFSLRTFNYVRLILSQRQNCSSEKAI